MLRLLVEGRRVHTWRCRKIGPSVPFRVRESTRMITVTMLRIATRAQVVTVLANATLNRLSGSDLSLVGIRFMMRPLLHLISDRLRADNQAKSRDSWVKEENLPRIEDS